MSVMVTATLAMSEEKSTTVGLILPLLNRLRSHFTPGPLDEEFEKSLKQAVGADLVGQNSDPELVLFLEEASALDPRTKTKPCITNSTWDILCLKAVAINSKPIVKQETDNSATGGAQQPQLPQIPDISTDYGEVSMSSEAPIVPMVSFCLF